MANGVPFPLDTLVSLLVNTWLGELKCKDSAQEVHNNFMCPETTQIFRSVDS